MSNEYTLRSKDVCTVTGVSKWTLTKWSNDGWVDCRRRMLPTGRESNRRYSVESLAQVEHLMGTRRQRGVHGRVGSTKRS